MKKFMTVALATAMTAALACTAFAGDVDYGTIGSEDQWGKFINPGQFLDDITGVATCELLTEGLEELNGCYEVSAASDGWGWDAVNLSEDNVDGDTVIIPCKFEATDVGDDGYPFAKIQIQYWAEGTVKVTQMVLKDASGNVLYDSAAASSADTAPIIYLAAIVGIAGLAMVASKKRA